MSSFPAPHERSRTAYYSLVTSHYPLLTTHHSRLTTHHSPLTTHHSPLPGELEIPFEMEDAWLSMREIEDTTNWVLASYDQVGQGQG